MSDQRPRSVTDRDLIVAFATIAVSLMALALVAGLAAKLFIWIVSL